MKSKLLSKRLYDYISRILITRLDLRDSDDKLIAHIWFKEASELGRDLEKTTGIEFLALIRDGYFTSSESIRRSRQKVQEEIPDTRGKKYSQRHKKAVEVRDLFASGGNNLTE